MKPILLCLSLMICAIGCTPNRPPAVGEPNALLTAEKVALHSFSGPKDWDNNGELDGVETHVEAIDHFGDPCKTFGHFLFEIYTYRRAAADPKGKRIGWWEAPMNDVEQHQQHWQRISRTYRFSLGTEQPLPLGRKYVMTVSLTRPDGQRLFDQRVFSW